MVFHGEISEVIISTKADEKLHASLNCVYTPGCLPLVGFDGAN